MRELDTEWIALIELALKLGITKEEVRMYLQGKGRVKDWLNYKAPFDFDELMTDKESLEGLIKETNEKEIAVYKEALKRIKKELGKYKTY